MTMKENKNTKEEYDFTSSNKRKINRKNSEK
jgi:hypothetical protein